MSWVIYDFPCDVCRENIGIKTVDTAVVGTTINMVSECMMFPDGSKIHLRCLKEEEWGKIQRLLT